MGTTLTVRGPSETGGTGVGIDDEFTSSYRSSLGRLIGYFRSKGVPREEAADLANETMVRMLVHLKRHGRDRTDLGPLVRTIARNLLVERVRKQAPVIVPLGDDIDVADDALEPVDHMVMSERRDAVRKAIGSLSPRHRHVVSLWMDGRAPAEIARELGIKRNAVDAILHRARRSLAAKLDGGGVIGALALLGFRIRFLARRITNAIVAVDPSGHGAPAGLAIATMGVAAVLSLSGPANAAVAPSDATAGSVAASSATAKVERAGASAAAVAKHGSSEVVRKAAESTYEVDVVRAPAMNPVTGEQDEFGISIRNEPTGGRRSIVDDILEPVFTTCAARGACTEYKR
jgi:RNA polymerase sigma-70 factor (ECF subfamily)